VSGHAGLDTKDRQQILLNTLCTREEIARINPFTQGHPGAGAPSGIRPGANGSPSPV
jgi:hypothetical protein